jgi:AcrR family transcriptional regulator
VLLLALMHVINTYREQVPPALAGLGDPLERFRAVYAAFCRVVADNIDATVLVYRSTNSLPADQRDIVKRGELETGAMIADTIRDCVAAKLFRDVDVDLATFQVLMSVHMWALKNWHFKARIDLDAYIAGSVDTLVRGFATPTGLARHLREAAPNVG